MSFFAGEQPFHALAETARDAEQYLRSDLGLAFFVAGELALAYPNLLRKGYLIGIEATELAQTPPDEFPIHICCALFGHGFSLTPVYHTTYIITMSIRMSAASAALSCLLTLPATHP